MGSASWCTILLLTVIACAIVYPIQERFIDEEVPIQKVFQLPEPSTTWKTDTIPRIIHQTAPLEQYWEAAWDKCQDSWRENFPDWTYILWTDDEIDDFMKQFFPSFYPLFRAYDRHIKRVDVFRYFVLYEIGGLYADMDYVCYRNFENELPLGKVSLNQSKIDVYQNALMASAPRHPFWLYVFVELWTDPSNEYVIVATGPDVLQRAAKRAKGKDYVHQLPCSKFSNCDNDDMPQCFCRHLETGNWKRERDVAIQITIPER
jgi:mannosyltransferase OCH1-like enzyme